MGKKTYTTFVCLLFFIKGSSTVWDSGVFNKRRKIKILSFFLVGMLMLYPANRFLFSFSSITNGISSVFLYPFLLAQRSLVVPTKQFFERRTRRYFLEQRVHTQTKKNHDLLAENIRLRASLAYHDTIEELIDFKKRYHDSHAMIAQIIFRQMNEEEHFFLINKGSLHGVFKDMVSMHKNVLIGRVTQVYPLYSKLVLVTDKSCKVAAYCARTKASGIHVGTNMQGKATLQRVSHLARMKQGDMVISSGEGLVFPQGFGLGRVRTAQLDGLHYTIDVEPLIAFNTLNYCALLQKGAQTVY